MLTCITIAAAFAGVTPLPVSTPTLAPARTPASATPVPSGRSLDELVPGPCLFYVSVDIPETKKELGATPLQSAWDSSGLAGDWERALELLSENISEEMTDWEFEPEDFSWMLSGEMAFFVRAFDAEVDDNGQYAFPSVGMIADAGSRKGELDSFMSKWTSMMREEGLFSEESFEGATLYSMRDPNPGAAAHQEMRDPDGVFFTQVDSLFAIALDEETLRTVMRAANGERDIARLAADADYAMVRERTGHPRAMSFYADVKGIFDLLRIALEGDEEQAMFDDVLQILGMADMRGMGGGYAIKPNGVWTKMFVHNAGEQDGMVWDVMGQSASTTPPAFLPPDIISYSTMHIDFASMWDNTMRLVDVVSGVDPTMPDDPVAEVEMELGIDFVDLFQALDGELILYSRPGEETSADPFAGLATMGMTGLDFALRLRDTAAVEQLMSQLEERMTTELGFWPFDESDYMGRSVHSLSPELAGEMPFTPAFTITDNLLLFAMSSDNLHSIVRRLGTEEPGVAQTESFKRVAQYLPKDAGYVQYTSADAVEGAMGQFEMMFGMMAMSMPEMQQEAELMTEMFPKVRGLIGTFDAGFSYATTNSEGCLMTSAWLFAGDPK